jgi:rubrerythrin
MKRDTLRRYLASLVLASLPGCCSNYVGPEEESVDAAVLSSVDGGVDPAQLPPELCRRLCRGASICHTSPQLDLGELKVECVNVTMQSCGPVFGAGGRPPAGLRPVEIPRCEDPVGAYFAYMAHVEGAAVFGFRNLARELTALGAPMSLVSQALRAADDERRHARIARRLARDYAATPASVEVEATPPRSALAIALDNATEGGVYETFAVLVTLHQSLTAADRRVRAAFARIADDELRHAELAQAVARFLEPRLSAEERAQVAQARRDAAARLAAELDTPFHPRLVALAGMPPRETTRRWLSQMTERLWS